MPAINDFIDKEQSEGLTNFEEQLQPEAEQEQMRSAGIDISFLKAQTGDGPVEDYIDHALNFNSSKATARIIRGLTGMLGGLNYAIVDVLLGALELAKGRKKVIPSVD